MKVSESKRFFFWRDYVKFQNVVRNVLTHLGAE